MARLIKVVLKGSDCLCDVLKSARNKQRQTIRNPKDQLQGKGWTGDSCRTSEGQWGTVQPDGSCKVAKANYTVSY